MEVHARKLLTIVTETALESTLVRDIEHLGAQGYTITDARGKGRQGVRSAGWEASSNIRLEVLCTDETAMAIAAHCRKHYYEHYAMTLFVVDVGIWRPEKF
jgi:nitrogen regulatory protein PII